MLTANQANSQMTQPPTNADDGSPYGGVPIMPGALGISTSQLTKPKGNTTTGSCASDDCVLTGQYNRYRTSANVNAANLAGGVERAAARDPQPVDGRVVEEEVARRKAASRARGAFDDTHPTF
jgi:hypothetical protein